MVIAVAGAPPMRPPPRPPPPPPPPPRAGAGSLFASSNVHVPEKSGLACARTSDGRARNTASVVTVSSLCIITPCLASTTARGRRLHIDRQKDGERCALAELSVHFDPAVALADNSVHCRQSEA